MAWTAPRTWVTGEVVSAGNMNTHVRDNLLETAPAKAAAAGDLLYANAANALSVLGLGTKGEHAVVNDGETAPVWVPGIDIIDRDMSDVDVANDAAETSIYSHSIAAGSLGTTGGIRLTIMGDLLVNAAGTFIMRIKLGATTVFANIAFDMVNNANRGKWWLEVVMLNSTASAQEWGVRFQELRSNNNFAWKGAESTSGSVAGGYATSAEDTSSAKTLDVTADWSAASASLSFRKKFAILERLAAA